MPTIIKEIRLIMADAKENSNKYWTGRLFDNSDVETIWGRIGVTKDSKQFPSAGESFLLKKEREKLKKGYKPLKTIDGSTVETKSFENTDLHRIAKEQIKTKNPILEKLIKQLVDYNIHKITSSTQITYNASTGLFTTPLGIVTLEGIDEARKLLVDLKPFIKGQEYKDKKFINALNEYLMLVPQNVGMKIRPELLFPDLDSIKKQSDTLDSLEASVKAMQNPVTQDNTKLVEKVFEVNFDLIEDSKEIDRINKFYRSTANGSHVSYSLKIKQVYSIEIASMLNSFKEGLKCGNVKELWHGTKKANILSILKSGLYVSPPSTAAIAGKMFGNGIYFSDQSTKSLNYAYGYWDGKYENNCFMFMADVAMGKSYIPNNADSSLPKAGYDSTFAIGGKSGVGNNEMIVYNNNQVNLKYLVEFDK